MANDCPYCSLAQKKGELYCSRHDLNMNTMKSGVFSITKQSFEMCDPHVTRFSLNFNLDTTQEYYLDSHPYFVSPQRLLIINEGQRFRTAADFDRPAKMITLAYEIGLPAKIYSSLQATHDSSLDNSACGTPADQFIFNQTLSTSPEILNQVAYLISEESKNCSSAELNNLLEDILEAVLLKLTPSQQEMMSLHCAKIATKKELYQRLQWAKEYLEAYYHRSISVDEIAEQACLSRFYFKRVFRQVFNISPYQYIKQLRLTKAKELLQLGYPVHECCKMVGWEDPSSFIRLFRETHATTPGQFKVPTPIAESIESDIGLRQSA
jgi:AraC-like DNA-binding protein